MSVALPIAAADLIDARPEDARHITGPRDIRAVRTLRISVTDRCNFRCVYCMPEDKLDWVPRERLLSFEEIATVVRAAVGLGIRSFKLTGGEPLVRHDLPRLVALLRAIPGVEDLSLTTNGALLGQPHRAAQSAAGAGEGTLADALRTAELDRLTVSMDTLRPDRFREITRGGELSEVWRGVRAAVAAGFRHPKINCVAMRGINDDEFAAFAALTREADVTVRFIEYMPLGRTALGGDYETRFIGEYEIRSRVESQLGPLVPADRDAGHGPAVVWRLPGARGRIGFISAMSKPFCEACNRLRLTAEGQLRSCLFDGGEVELRPILRRASTAARATGTRLPRDADSPIRDELRAAFVHCTAFKPEVHSYFGNRQMSQIGG